VVWRVLFCLIERANVMDMGLLTRGLIIGFSIAAPVGPIGILVIRRTLSDGRMTGLATGLGAATADALYGCIGAFGLTFITGALLGGQVWLRVVGGIFLCYLGIRTFLASPSERAAPATGATLLRSYGSTLLLTLTNPSTILSFAAVFAGLGLGNTKGQYSLAATLVGGVFLGSALWWLLLSAGINRARARISAGMLIWINRFAGIVILSFGALALLTLLY
jgi:threonine/homoserine/homoserine lactone efflux protein